MHAILYFYNSCAEQRDDGRVKRTACIIELILCFGGKHMEINGNKWKHMKRMSSLILERIHENSFSKAYVVYMKT